MKVWTFGWDFVVVVTLNEPSAGVIGQGHMMAEIPLPP
jgi:hypothetical protein